MSDISASTAARGTRPTRERAKLKSTTDNDKFLELYESSFMVQNGLKVEEVIFSATFCHISFLALPLMICHAKMGYTFHNIALHLGRYTL